MYVCHHGVLCMYMNTCIYVYIYTYVCVYMYTCVYAFKVCMFVIMGYYVRTCISVCTRVRASRLYTHIHMHTYTSIRT